MRAAAGDMALGHMTETGTPTAARSTPSLHRLRSQARKRERGGRRRTTSVGLSSRIYILCAVWISGGILSLLTLLRSEGTTVGEFVFVFVGWPAQSLSGRPLGEEQLGSFERRPYCRRARRCQRLLVVVKQVVEKWLVVGLDDHDVEATVFYLVLFIYPHA